MSVGSHTTNMPPNWLAVIWTLVFFVIIATHARHVIQSEGQRRWWHSGVLLWRSGWRSCSRQRRSTTSTSRRFWSLAFANGAITIVLWMLVQVFAGRGANLLWLLMAFDLGAMAYMWSPTGFQVPITWLLVAYFAVQAVLWGIDWMRSSDEQTILGGAVLVTPDGASAASVAEPLICYKDLRVSMAAMTLSMAYMFAATPLVRS